MTNIMGAEPALMPAKHGTTNRVIVALIAKWLSAVHIVLYEVPQFMADSMPAGAGAALVLQQHLLLIQLHNQHMTGSIVPPGSTCRRS
jgi:hypothetical protein